MGRLRFFVPRPERVPARMAECAYLAGMEDVPWRRTASWESDGSRGELVIERVVDESGKLYVPWQVEGHGELVLTTASLMERADPYNLPLELARGTLNALRNQAAVWELSGILLSEEATDAINVASRAFVHAITSLPDEETAADEAEAAIVKALDAAIQLTHEYARQTLASRKRETKQLTTLFAATLESEVPAGAAAETVLGSFNAAVVPFTWREVEQTAGKYDWTAFDEQIAWCESNNLRVIGGPLLRLDDRHLPDWIYLWEDDFAQLQAYFAHYISATVEHFKGNVQVWNCAARMNVGGAITLQEEQKLRLIVSAVEEVRRSDPQTPMIVSFDHPWAEYLASAESDLSPLHVADSLIRADFGLAGIGLELNIGYHPGGTLPRALLEYLRQLDTWSELGLPLIIHVTIPSAVGTDEHARHDALAVGTGDPVEAQAILLEQLLPVLVAKPYVHGVVWNEMSDAATHNYAHGGLFDAAGTAKPLCQTLGSFRQQHLI